MKLLWIDIETTGLDPQKEQILEVAYILTDRRLFELSRGQMLVCPAGGVNTVYESCHDFVRTMHDKNGLWDALRELEHSGQTSLSPPNSVYDAGAWLWGRVSYAMAAAPDEQLRLAGQSVQFDRAFLEHHMQALTKRLHYRQLDFRSVLHTVEDVIGEEAYAIFEASIFPREVAHRAMCDIEKTLEGYRAVVALLSGIRA